MKINLFNAHSYFSNCFGPQYSSDNAGDGPALKEISKKNKVKSSYSFRERPTPNSQTSTDTQITNIQLDINNSISQNTNIQLDTDNTISQGTISSFSNTPETIAYSSEDDSEHTQSTSITSNPITNAVSKKTTNYKSNLYRSHDNTLSYSNSINTTSDNTYEY
jgi:hypothetical protein